ncbi:uncharacterized protein RAG0_03867 [Rhynchosporium agropyri]|uniref:Uncharacterized protein n=1 Tax=Rhynchosporium agropyri TaxID=914238 RepID=A0A1E1K6I9_9HELO|nr:uncharacterized protein RAG0_03867 [Rhynchosporium agropyri]
MPRPASPPVNRLFNPLHSDPILSYLTHRIRPSDLSVLSRRILTRPLSTPASQRDRSYLTEHYIPSVDLPIFYNNTNSTVFLLRSPAHSLPESNRNHKQAKRPQAADIKEALELK